ncbi:M23 family metallopeptidase [Oceanirhabdus sp. W0125-5]|uniref:M23 family metallopeptidase n=1 Tax=Oceanirhabdus sp. W0125-5 TaxID=2999116 RepID=UPI0022F33C44|nr:M23 family metallopeptidase [Oceanirhabdus sp. W0125-5]WBW95116.1 M23 family metallopeptidase [Oceanirhabdus sp. W0125-5]
MNYSESYQINYYNKHYGRGQIIEKVIVEGGPVNTSKNIDILEAGIKVTIIHQENNWFYIEYYSDKGKKRGYIPTSRLSINNFRYDFKIGYSIKNAKVKSSSYVYYTPNGNSLKIRSLKSNQVVLLLEEVGDYYFIDFSTTNGRKGNIRGFIKKDALEILGTPKYDFPDSYGYITNWMSPSHPSGVDIGGVGYNTSIIALADGIIEYKYIRYTENDIDYLISYGLYADLITDSGLILRYAHLSKFNNNIKTPNLPTMQKSAYKVSGETSISAGKVSVTKGDIIGLTGNTGNSYGPHIHLETKFNNVRENPFKYFKLPWCLY